MSAPRRGESARSAVAHPGDSVATRDGHELGRVERVSDGAFMIDPAHEDAFWLSKAVLLHAEDGRLVMDFDVAVLDDYKMEGPVAAAGSPRLDAQVETFETRHDIALKREHMEHPQG